MYAYFIWLESDIFCILNIYVDDTINQSEMCPEK